MEVYKLSGFLLKKNRTNIYEMRFLTYNRIRPRPLVTTFEQSRRLSKGNEYMSMDVKRMF